MRRFLLLFFPGLIALVAIVAGAAWYLLHDEAFMKKRLGTITLEHTGRALEVDGALRIEPGKITVIEARGVRFPNPAWAKPDDMIRIGHLRIEIEVASLFADRLVIPALLLEDCTVNILENETGDVNWRVAPKKPPGAEAPGDSGPPVYLLDAQINDCSYLHDAPSRDRPLEIDIGQFSLKLLDNRRWEGSGDGSINGEALSLSGHMAPAGALLARQPLQYDVDVMVGRVKLQSKGSLQDPQAGEGANLSVQFSGPQITQVIDYFKLPPLSSGPFDFKLTLDSQGQMTDLELDGDLGSLQVAASGQLDRLRHPTNGQVKFELKGPDLGAVGATLGLPGMVNEAFDTQGEASFRPGIVNFKSFVLETAADHLELRGALGTGKALAGSDLDIELRTTELGRWAPLMGEPERSFGALTADGTLQTDSAGAATVQARLSHMDNSLTVDGELGVIGGKFRPDLQLDFHSDDASPAVALLSGYQMPSAKTAVRGHLTWEDHRLTLDRVTLEIGGHRSSIDGVVDLDSGLVGSHLEFGLQSPSLAELGALFGQTGLPVAPFSAKGGVARPDDRIRLDQVELALADHYATVNGLLNPQKGLAGSDIEVRLVSPDITALAKLFGGGGKLREPIELVGRLQPDGTGLAFEFSDGKVGGGGRIQARGRIPDLEHPLALDADFDISVPSLAPFSVFAPELGWPDIPAAASGQFHNAGDRTRLESVKLQAGKTAIGVSGELDASGRFKLSVQARGTDATELAAWIDQSLPAESFTFSSEIVGDRSTVELGKLAAQLGASQANGMLKIEMGERRRVSGNLASPALDLSWLETTEAKDQEKPETQEAYVFDDTPVAQVTDIGLDVDVQLTVDDLQLVNTRLQEIKVGLLLSGSQLQIKPFSLNGPSGGTFSGTLSLDTRQSNSQLHFELTGRDVTLGLAAAADQDMATYPHASIDVALDGVGATRREMASGLNGRLRLEIGPGQVASSAAELLLTDFITQLFSQLNPFAARSAYTQLECAVAGAMITEGQMQVMPVVVQTEQLTILSQGTIDLRSERIDLSFNTKPRKGVGLSAGVLINPFIKVGGRLAKPAIQLDRTGAMVSSGTAVATAGLSLVARSFSDRFLASKDPCGDARAELEKLQSAQP